MLFCFKKDSQLPSPDRRGRRTEFKVIKRFYLNLPLKMKIFVFDTETTGFINKNEKDLDKQPKIIQFA
ncbi:MAG: hypothetical protein LBQ59_00940 [Candidatus Peribacteria bacterium]|nr:hypothetical protein [Candidatus Peribacteria bacterium]